MPTSFQVRASMVEAALLSASTSARCGLRVERLPPPSPLSLSPTPLLRHGVGPLSLRLRQQTLFAFPFPLPHRHLRFSPVSIRFNSNAPRNLRLLFRAVNAGMLRFLLQSHVSHTDRHILPTHKRKKPTTFHAHGSSLLSVCDAGPNPRPMCGAPPDCFAPAMSATASLTPSSPRLRARAGRLTVCGASSSTESLSLRCATRHLPFALILLWATPSSFHSFADIHLRFAPCVITAHRHRSTPRLDMSIGVKGERSAVASSAKPLHSVKNVNSHVAEI